LLLFDLPPNLLVIDTDRGLLLKALNLWLVLLANPLHLQKRISEFELELGVLLRDCLVLQSLLLNFGVQAAELAEF
jgi:hypothetical protein